MTCESSPLMAEEAVDGAGPKDRGTHQDLASPSITCPRSQRTSQKYHRFQPLLVEYFLHPRHACPTMRISSTVRRATASPRKIDWNFNCFVCSTQGKSGSVRAESFPSTIQRVAFTPRNRETCGSKSLTGFMSNVEPGGKS